jgi:hypothetical protein
MAPLPPHATVQDMQAAISQLFNACCPAAITLHRQLDPAIENWGERCKGRIIGLRWNAETAQVICEWPIGSGALYNQGALAFEYMKIYASASRSFKGEVTHPNAWKDLIVCKQEEDWIRLDSILPRQIRTKVTHGH